MIKCLEGVARIGKADKQCAVVNQVRQASPSSWVTVPIQDAQCTAGAKSANHSAKIRISDFNKRTNFSVEPYSSPKSNAVKDAMQSHPKAKYVGNGPIYMEGSNSPNGYVKSNGKVLNPIDCVKYKSNTGNLGKENSVFVRYRPRTSSGEMSTSGDWKYRLVSTEFLCNQLQPQPYVDWLQGQLPRGSDVQTELKKRKRWEPQDDLVSSSQIDFAIQSGPAVLRDGQNLLDGYNSATSYRSYMGVTNNGDPVVVEADGNIGSFCLGQFLKAQGVRDLLHRDSFISDAAFREGNGNVTGYPSVNPNAKAASVLIISE